MKIIFNKKNNIEKYLLYIKYIFNYRKYKNYKIIKL